jgi:hypothetical protein
MACDGERGDDGVEVRVPALADGPGSSDSGQQMALIGRCLQPPKMIDGWTS